MEFLRQNFRLSSRCFMMIWLIPQTMMTFCASHLITKNHPGTLEYVRGSHKWGLQPPKGEFHSPDDYREQLKFCALKKIIQMF